MPLHSIELHCGFVNGEVPISVIPSLPVDGIDLILGYNLGRVCVFPCQISPPLVVNTGIVLLPQSYECLEDFPEVFTACTITRAVAQSVDHGYFVQDGMLLRRWTPDVGPDMLGQVRKVVLPVMYQS